MSSVPQNSIKWAIDKTRTFSTDPNEEDWRESQGYGHSVSACSFGEIDESISVFSRCGSNEEEDLLDSQESGSGVCLYASVNRYDGGWQEGKKHGQGVYLYASGDRYDGDWQEGKKHGQGVYLCASGDRYDGGWQEGKKHGKGICIDALGGCYEGVWVEGQKQGSFILTAGEDKKVEIEFENDIPLPKDAKDGITIEHIQMDSPSSSYALIIQSTQDNNEAFANTEEFDSIIHQLKKITHDVIIKKIGSLTALSELKLDSEHQEKVSHVVIRAHGCSAGMEFGELATIEYFKPLLDQLSPSPLIILDSCSTGEGASSIGQQIANAKNATVIAPNRITSHFGILSVNNETHTILKVAMIGKGRFKGIVQTFLKES